MNVSALKIIRKVYYSIFGVWNLFFAEYNTIGQEICFLIAAIGHASELYLQVVSLSWCSVMNVSSVEEYVNKY